MPIEFHCIHCSKLVRAPDEAGGKHGKCPSCHQTVYIPLPEEQLEPLALAPVDESFEREKERLLRETRQFQSKVLTDREAQPERGSAAARNAGGPAGGSTPSKPFVPQMSMSEMNDLVIQYAVAMVAGKLADAEELSRGIRKHANLADEVMNRISADEIPPNGLEGVPKPVLAGLFRQLREHK